MTTMEATESTPHVPDEWRETDDVDIFPDFPDTSAAWGDEHFSIRDESSANWLLKKLANLEAEKVRITAQFQEIIAGLDRDRERLEGRFREDLALWAAGEIEARGDGKKSIRLLQGTISFCTVPASVKVSDAEAALVEARTAFPDLVQTIVKLDTVGYRKAAAEALTERGELLPGVERVPERESMSLKFGGGKG